MHTLDSVCSVFLQRAELWTPLESGIPSDYHPALCLAGPTPQCLGPRMPPSWICALLVLSSHQPCELLTMSFWTCSPSVQDNLLSFTAELQLMGIITPGPAALPTKGAASHLTPAWPRKRNKSNGNRTSNGVRPYFKWLLNILPTLWFYDYFPFQPLLSFPVSFCFPCLLIYKYCFSSYPEKIKLVFCLMVLLLQFPNKAPCPPWPWWLILPFILPESMYFCREGTPQPKLSPRVTDLSSS